MNDTQKQIVNEAVAIIASECAKQKDCGGCPFVSKYGMCIFIVDSPPPKDWKPPFKTKKEAQWLSGKVTEVIDSGR